MFKIKQNINLFIDDLDPPTVISYHKFKFFNGLRLWNISFDKLFSSVQGYAPWPRSDVSIVCIGHLAYSIDNAPHHADL